MSLARFGAVVLAVVALSLGPALWLLGRGLETEGRWAALFGAGLAGVNAVGAFALVRWSHHRGSAQGFLAVVVGGMMGRMALMLAAVVWGVLGLGLPKVPLATTLLAYFVLFLVFELRVLHKQTTPVKTS